MKEYQYLIGKIIVAVAIIVAAIIIAQAIGGAGESIRSSLFQLSNNCSSFFLESIILTKQSNCSTTAFCSSLAGTCSSTFPRFFLEILFLVVPVTLPSKRV